MRTKILNKIKLIPNNSKEIFWVLQYSNMPTDTHMLKPVANCKHCNAKKFEHEPLGFCCHDGKIKLNELNVPNELMRLWSSNDADSGTFVTTLGFSTAISLSLLYIVALIKLLQA
jgi:hypothetical protein